MVTPISNKTNIQNGIANDEGMLFARKNCSDMWSPPLATPYSVAVRIQWIRISRRLACQCHFNCMVLHGIAWHAMVLYGMVWPWQLGKVGMNGIAVRRMWFAWYLWLRWTPYPSPFPVSYIHQSHCRSVWKHTVEKTQIKCNQCGITFSWANHQTTHILADIFGHG